jgi:hypothetical protein
MQGWTERGDHMTHVDGAALANRQFNSIDRTVAVRSAQRLEGQGARPASRAGT